MRTNDPRAGRGRGAKRGQPARTRDDRRPLSKPSPGNPGPAEEEILHAALEEPIKAESTPAPITEAIAAPEPLEEAPATPGEPPETARTQAVEAQSPAAQAESPGSETEEAPVSETAVDAAAPADETAPEQEEAPAEVPPKTDAAHQDEPPVSDTESVSPETTPAPAEKAAPVYLTSGRRPAKNRGRAGRALPPFLSWMKPSGQAKRPPTALIAGLAVIVLLGASAFILPTLLSGQPTVAYAQAWQVLVGDRVLAVVADRDEAQAVVDDVLADKSDAYNAPVQTREAVAYQPVEVEADYLGSLDDLRQAVDRNVIVNVEAWAIVADGQTLTALPSRNEAYDALMQVLAPYQQLSDGTVLSADEIAFEEDVTVARRFVEPSLVLSVDDAAALLTAGNDPQRYTYTVVQGDTLSKIASHFGVSVDDLRTMNEDIADTDVIQVGQTLYVAIPRQTLNVRCTLIRSREETIAYTTRTEQVNTMYADQQKVVTAGQDGLRRLEEEFTYVNGMLVSTQTLSDTVAREPVEKVVQKGTKLRAGTAVNTAGRWDLPLKAGTYTITSRFGMRTLNGVTRMHKGVDLAAPTGTPIYASRAGTVTFSGTASGYGLVIYIDHGNGLQTRYAHCSKLLVKAGDTVSKGQQIAKVGNTGVSTGPHVHFEVRINGVAVDPLS